MLQISFVLFAVSICTFALIMRHDPRTLWSGISLLGMLLCLMLTLFFLLDAYFPFFCVYIWRYGL